MRGFYSAKMAEIAGTTFYATPDGGEVEVTLVADSTDCCGWDDFEDRGPITRCLRKGRDAAYPDDLPEPQPYKMPWEWGSLR